MNLYIITCNNRDSDQSSYFLFSIKNSSSPLLTPDVQYTNHMWASVGFLFHWLDMTEHSACILWCPWLETSYLFHSPPINRTLISVWPKWSDSMEPLSKTHMLDKLRTFICLLYDMYIVKPSLYGVGDLIHFSEIILLNLITKRFIQIAPSALCYEWVNEPFN